MSGDRELGTDWEAFQEARKARHREWKERNSKILEATKMVYRVTNGGECFVFRTPIETTICFYPSTGRWQDTADKSVYKGGAGRFLSWYKKRFKIEKPT